MKNKLGIRFYIWFCKEKYIENNIFYSLKYWKLKGFFPSLKEENTTFPS
jgi:hypothetical protein